MEAADVSVGTALRAVWLGSGTLVFLAFLYPGPVGSLASGRLLLVLALAFFGSSLLTLSTMPAPGGSTDRDGTTGDGPDGRRWLRPLARLAAEQEPLVVGVVLGGLALVLGCQLLVPSRFAGFVDLLSSLLFAAFGWAFLWIAVLAVAFCAAIVVGPWGDVRLGGPDAEPDYSLPAYAAIVFTAGIAAGLVLSGSTDALAHYRRPAPVTGAAPQSAAAVVAALEATMLHWGVSAWSLYAAVGVPVAYFAYRADGVLRPAAAIAPVVGTDRLDGVPARAVDAVVVLAIVAGVGSSLATVTTQFLAGVAHQWGVSVGRASELLFVVGVTVTFTAAAVSGLARGVRRIATLTVLVFALLSVLLFVQGPTGPVTRTALAAAAGYVESFAALSVAVRDVGWRAQWTAFYWGWWFAWAGFVGLLLAGLSKGRRLRTVVLAGVVAPSAATLAWVGVVGGTVLEFQHEGLVDLAPLVQLSGESVAAYPIFEELLLGRLMVFLLLAVVVTFVVASADAATVMLALAGARPGRVPSAASLVFWGGVQGAVTLVMVSVADDEALRTFSAAVGGPVALIGLVGMVGMAWHLWQR